MITSKSINWKYNLKRIKNYWGGMLVIPILFFSCRPSSQNGTQPISPKDTTNVQTTTQYDFYIENSGSMMGYFNGNSISKTIITEYFNRIDEENGEQDTITLNYVNNQIIPISNTLKTELVNIERKCKATYTKIDDILELVMNNYNRGKVAIVISDFCFTSDDGSFSTAQSYITKTFRKYIKEHKEFSVIIRKYQTDFNGKYYPGGLKCKSERPIYIWIMGANNNLRKFLNIDIKEQCKQLALQSKTIIVPEIIKGKSLTARSINNQDNSILVSEWKKERNEDCYKIHFQLDLSNIILSRNDILNRKNYSLSNNRYIIENIKPIDNKYEFTIQTGKPSPGIVELSYKKNLPDWIENSNYGGPGIPPTDQTLGIKYLINGVFDAYVGGEIFRTKITLK